MSTIAAIVKKLSTPVDAQRQLAIHSRQRPIPRHVGATAREEFRRLVHQLCAPGVGAAVVPGPAVVPGTAAPLLLLANVAAMTGPLPPKA